jgi:hypothetical protein
MERYRIHINSSINLRGLLDEGTLEELKNYYTVLYFLGIDDPDRPYLVYDDEDYMKSDPDGRYAIGFLEPIQEMD